MTKIQQPADPRQWQPVIYSLLAYFLSAFLIDMATIFMDAAQNQQISQEQIQQQLTSPQQLLFVVVVQLFFLDLVRRRCRWTWTDVGFNRFSKRQWELLWQIPLYLATIYTLKQLLEGKMRAWSPEASIVMRGMEPVYKSPVDLLLALATILPLEIMLRGFVQNFVRARWGSLAAVLATPLAIGLVLLLTALSMPTNQRPPLVLLWPIFISLAALNLLQERHRNLWVLVLVQVIGVLIAVAIN